MRVSCAVLVVGLLVLTSCITYRFQASSALADSGQKTDVVAVTKGPITVEGRVRLDSELRFDLTVKNSSNKTIVVNSDRFRLLEGRYPDWSEAKLFSSDEYYQRHTNRVTSFQVVSSDGYSSTKRSPGGTAVNKPIKEPVPTQVDAMDRTAFTRLEWLHKNLLYPTSLAPGETKFGVVFAPASTGPFCKLIIPIEGQNFELLFERVAQQVLPFTEVVL